MPWARKKTAAEMTNLCERLPRELNQRRAKQANMQKAAADTDPWEAGTDPWEAGDPWLMTEATQQVCPVPDEPWAGACEGASAESLELDPWAAAPEAASVQSKKTLVEIDLGLELATAAAAAAAQGSQPKESAYSKRALLAARVARECEAACPRHCQLPGCQKKGLSVQAALQFVADFWALPPDQQGHCLRAAYYSGDMYWSGPELRWARVQPSGRSTSWQVGKVKLCFSRMCRALGAGQRTIRKMIAGTMDGRKKLPGAPAPIHLSEQFIKCNTFFTELHQSAAVPDPEDTCCASSPAVQQSSSPAENPWENWDYDWGGQSPITVACQGRVLGLPRRYLGHIRLIDLYWQMASEWSVLQDLRPAVGPMPSFSTFVRCYRGVWKKLLVFRGASTHSRCQLCADLQSIMQRSHVSWSDRTEAAQRLRQHLRDQYTDRMLYWSMRWSSRQAVQPEVICIIIDSMGKWGSAWPKFNHDKIPKELELISRPTMILTAALAHGWCTGLYFSLEPFGHGSVRALTVIIRATQSMILLVTFS
jgi:hypothetical protein